MCETSGYEMDWGVLDCFTSYTFHRLAGERGVLEHCMQNSTLDMARLGLDRCISIWTCMDLH